MKTTVSRYDFEQAFAAHGRKDQFTYDGLNLLFDYLESYEEETGQEIELDVIAICCDYNEESYEGITKNYIIDLEGCESEQDMIEAVRDYLNENTTLVGETDTGFVYAAF